MQICPTECCTSRVELKFHPNIHNFSSNFKVPSTPQVVGPERLLAALFGTFGKSVSAARWPQPSLTKTQNCRRLSPAVSASNKQQLERTTQLRVYLFVLLLLLFASTRQLVTSNFSNGLYFLLKSF